MSTKQTTPVSNKLAPTIASSTAKAKLVAAADGRKRAIVAINEDGKLVVCCRRTAKKNGWDIQEALYERAKTAEAPAEPVAKPKRKPKKADNVDDLLG